MDSSGGLLRWTPTNARSWVPVPRNADVFSPYAAGGTWLGCGLGGVEYGAPLEYLVASAGVPGQCVFFGVQIAPTLWFPVLDL